MEDEDKEYLRQLYEMYKESGAQYDKQILYISSGALGISMTFISDIVQLESARKLCLLGISWVLLAMIIMISLASHFTSMKALNAIMSDPNLEKNKVAKRLDNWVKAFNWIMLLFLPIALFFLISFILTNITNG